MYEESNQDQKKDWKGIILKCVLIILAIALVYFLLPLNKNNKEEGLSQTFQSNMNSLREAANNHFSQNDRPESVGQTIRISLADLVRIGAISELRDNDNNLCDEEESYASLTRTTTNFELEIKLICDEEEDSENSFMAVENNNSTTTTTTTSATTTTTTRANSNITTRATTTARPNTTRSTTTTTRATTTTTRVEQQIFTVTFNSNGGSAVAMQRINYNNVVAKPSNPTRTGYTFAGWVASNGSLYNFSTPVTSNIILKATWTLNSSATTANMVTVTFNTNGGTSIAPKTIVAGSTLSRPTNPTKANAVFVGWRIYNTTQSFDFNTRVNNNITLVAIWRITETKTIDVYSAGWGTQVSNFSVTHDLKIPSSLTASNITNPRIKSVQYIRSFNSTSDLWNHQSLHSSTFEYTSNGSEYTLGGLNNIAGLGAVSVTRVNTNQYPRQIRWTGNVIRQCSLPFSFQGVNNACIYGIVYRVTWEYEIER